MSVPIGAVICYAFLWTHSSSVISRTALSDAPHSSTVVSHTALNWHRLLISAQDCSNWVPNSCTGITSGTRLKNECILVCPQCTLSATSGKRYKWLPWGIPPEEEDVPLIPIEDSLPIESISQWWTVFLNGSLVHEPEMTFKTILLSDVLKQYLNATTDSESLRPTPNVSYKNVMLYYVDT